MANVPFNLSTCLGQDSVCERAVRPVRYGCDGVRQHVDAAGGLHQDDGEGEGCRHPTHHARVQGTVVGVRLPSKYSLIY